MTEPVHKLTEKDGHLIRCPCCRNEYETADHIPFTREDFDLHIAAAKLFAMCKEARDYIEASDIGPVGRRLLGSLNDIIAKVEGRQS